jgi:toxin ParE1/3/4
LAATFRITLTPLAQRDLSDIWINVAIDNSLAADRLLDSIGNRIGVLTEFPFLGSARPDIAAEARLLVEGNYLILYRVTDPVVEIIRVVHGARDLSDI